MVGVNDLARDVSKKANLTQRETKKVIDTLIGTIVDKVNKGEKINLVGFGIFERRIQSQRKARIPKTKRVINVPQKKKFVFRASSKIKYKK
jgi:DNA-binding protein HU-beta